MSKLGPAANLNKVYQSVLDPQGVPARKNRALIFRQSHRIGFAIIDRCEIDDIFIRRRKFGSRRGACTAFKIDRLTFIAFQEIHKKLCVVEIRAAFDDRRTERDRRNAFGRIYDVNAFRPFREHLYARRFISETDGIFAVVNAAVYGGRSARDDDIVHQLIDIIPCRIVVPSAEIGEYALQRIPCAGTSRRICGNDDSLQTRIEEIGKAFDRNAFFFFKRIVYPKARYLGVVIRQNACRIFKFGRHKLVVCAHVIFKILTVRQRIGIDKSAEHNVRLRIAGLRLNTGFALARTGLRVGDTEHDFPKKYQEAKQRHLTLLRAYDYPTDGLEALEREWFDAIEYLRQYSFVDSEQYLGRALREGRRVLAEGAQGSMLDIDFGSYPFVTSSNTIAAGCCTGLGIAPRSIGEVYGIFKAYCTRVGSGPFPTELEDETGERLCSLGHEFGSVTGRRRRCGWLDLVALRYTIMLSGVTRLIMMKSDVLDTFETIRVCTRYRIHGTETEDLPYELGADVEPIYEELPGWRCDTSRMTSAEEFPQELRDYIAFIEQAVGVPIAVVSVGPDREQTITLHPTLLPH